MIISGGRNNCTRTGCRRLFCGPEAAHVVALEVAIGNEVCLHGEVFAPEVMLFVALKVEVGYQKLHFLAPARGILCGSSLHCGVGEGSEIFIGFIHLQKDTAVEDDFL